MWPATHHGNPPKQSCHVRESCGPQFLGRLTIVIPGHFQRDPGATDLLYPDMISPLIPCWFPICGDHSPRHPPVKKPWLSENSMGKSSNGFPACHVSWPEGGWTTFETVSAWWSGYGSIPIDTFLVGWTSIYQLFWGSLGTRVLTHPHLGNPTKVWLIPSSLLRLAGRASSGVTWRDDTWLVAGWYI